MIDLPPPLILPDHWVGNRPAIIRSEVDPQRYFPAQISRAERRAVHAEFRRQGRVDAMLPGMIPVVGGSERDPYFANVVALLHMDGADGSTTFTDSSPLGATYTAVGNAQVDTAQSVFGGGSLLCDDVGDYLQGPSSSNYSFPAGTDFTVEAWTRFAATPVNEYILASATSGGLVFLVSSGNLRISRQATGDDISRTFSPTLNVWYHVAGTRSGTTYRVFIQGIQQGATVSTTVNYPTIAPRIGGNAASTDSFNGWIDDFRLTRGVARYTGSFTPPTRAFPNS